MKPDPSDARPAPPPDDDAVSGGSRVGDAWAGAILVALAIGVVVESTRWPPAVGFAGDPLVLPRALALLMTTVAIVLVVSAWRRPADAARTMPIRPVLLGVGATAALGALLEPVGLVVAAAGYLFAMQRITGAPLRRAVPVALVVPAVIWAVFHGVLNVPLPVGRLWSFGA